MALRASPQRKRAYRRLGAATREVPITVSSESNDVKYLPLQGTSEETLKGRRRLKSAFLFQGRREVVIVHEGEEYILRITRNGKLILTK